MPKNLSFSMLSSSGHKYKYRLEVIYKERHTPTTLSIFFCSVKYKKIEGKGFVADSKNTSSYSFDHNSGNLNYVSLHGGDFTSPGFRWLDDRVAFEHHAITDDHRAKAIKTAQRAYDHLLEQQKLSDDQEWREKYKPFLSPLEKILGVNE
ncbi:MAG: hypothetical protein Q8R47_05960 [Nanoarchaeota archaeon]|nr:hypothetical protein [Nanoarchaeota archaeon]